MIIERCQINRSTFYLHYTDIYDLLEKTEQRLLQQLMDAVNENWTLPETPKNFFAFLEQTFNILSENAQLCSALIGPNGDIAFLRNIEKMIRDKGLQTLRSFAPKELREQDLQYAISFALAGCVGLVEHWLKNGCPETPTHMAELTLVMLREGTTSIGVPDITQFAAH